MEDTKLYRATMDDGRTYAVHAPALAAAKRKVARLTRAEIIYIRLVRPGLAKCDHV
jgi:hypothetical protein